MLTHSRTSPRKSARVYGSSASWNLDDFLAAISPESSSSMPPRYGRLSKTRSAHHASGPPASLGRRGHLYSTWKFASYRRR